ncbi:aspartyl protease [Plectonema cf. radiosum LEGE 06105]|uniref:Aspartyl protease n=2 Tax=Plectonema TaxID=1183 RepID=A0A8J7JWL3_9CYAN|nr:aspartyl protease [Plectonema cf. radiosum LEGE 06105]
MIQGSFGSKGELYFEIGLIGADTSMIVVNALLDTGFTDYLAMNVQDVESLEWSFIREKDMRTARGETRFFLYQGTVIFDNQEFMIPALGGEEINEILIGLSWLETRRLVIDRKANLLTINNEKF